MAEKTTKAPERFLIQPGDKITAAIDREVRIGKFANRMAAVRYYLADALQAAGLIEDDAA